MKATHILATLVAATLPLAVISAEDSSKTETTDQKQEQSSDTTGMKGMMGKGQMMSNWKDQDAELDKLVAEMNSAPADKSAATFPRFQIISRYCAMLALLLMTGVDSRFFTGSGHRAWPMYFTAWKRFAPLVGTSAEIAFFNHDLFFWQNIKAYGGNNTFHRYPAVTPKPQFAMPSLAPLPRLRRVPL